MIKKKLSVILLAVFLLSSFHTGYSAADILKSDIGLLTALGIVDGSVAIDADGGELSRADFAKLAARFFGYTERDGSKYFIDLPADHEASGEITYLVSKSIITGDDRSRFHPDEPVTMIEALKMVVAGLGYNEYAMRNGGYPAGYMLTASRLKLDSGSSAADYQNGVTLDAAYNILNNALFASVMTPTVYGEDSVRFEVSGRQGFLYKQYNVESVKGKVIDNGITGLYGLRAAGKNRMRISSAKGELFVEVGDHNVKDLVGRNVEVYVKSYEDSDRLSLVYIKDDGSDYETLLYSTDISDYRDFTYYYSVNGRAARTAKISDDTAIIYNNLAVRSSNFDDVNFIPGIGTVTLIEDNESGKLSAVIIKDYSTIMVSSIDAEDEAVYDKYGKAKFETKKNNSDGLFITDINGNELSFSDISVDNILSVARATLDGYSYIEILVSPFMVNGEITSSEASAADARAYRVTVEQEQYKVTPEFAAYLANPRTEQKINLGQTRKFYLDVFGNIAGMADGSADNNLAYLITAKAAPGLGGDVQLKILFAEGVKIVNAASTLRINERPYRGAERMTNIPLKKNFNGVDALGQIIIYELNDNGEVASIKTTVGLSEATGSEEELVEVYTDVSTEIRYRSASRTFTGTVSGALSLTDFSTVFCIPQNDDAKDNSYKITNHSYLIHDAYYNASREERVTGYAFDSDPVVMDALLVYTKEASKQAVNNDTQMFLIDRVAEALTDEGELTNKLYGYYNGKEYSVLAAPDLDVSEINPGDLIRPGVDADGIMQNFDVSFDYKNRELPRLSSVDYQDVSHIGFGIVEKFKSPTARITWLVKQDGNLVTDKSYNYFLKGNIYIYDDTEAKPKISIGTIADFHSANEVGWDNASTVVIHMKYCDVKSITIYKFKK